jgi:hypothetical protein
MELISKLKLDRPLGQETSVLPDAEFRRGGGLGDAVDRSVWTPVSRRRILAELSQISGRLISW